MNLQIAVKILQQVNWCVKDSNFQLEGNVNIRTREAGILSSFKAKIKGSSLPKRSCDKKTKITPASGLFWVTLVMCVAQQIANQDVTGINHSY